jgi:hypothetical protein
LAFILTPLLPLALLLAQQPTRDTSSAAWPAQAIGTGVVSGVVMSAETRPQPVRRVIVTLSGAELPIGRSAITDDDGRFTIDQVPVGRFTLSATKPAYVPAAYGATRPGRPGVTFSLAAGQRLSNLAVTMIHGAAIGGTIRNQRGQPAVGVQVQAVRALPGGGFANSSLITYADDRGQYRLFGLVPGEYIVSCNQFAFLLATGEIGAMSSADIDTLLGALARRQAVAGTPAAAAELPRGRTVNPAPVFFPGVPSAAQAGRVALGPGEDRGDVDITLQPARTATVSGMIVAPTGSVSAVTITLAPRGPDVPTAVAPPIGARTGADGQFTFTGVNPGNYMIHARTATAPPGRPAGPADAAGTALWARAEVDVNGDDVSGLTLALQPMLHLTGRVVFDAATLAPPADLTKLRVAAASPLDAALRNAVEVGLASAASVGAVASVAADGTFELAIEPGTHNLSVSPLPTGWTLRSAIVGGKDVLDSPLEVAPGSTLPLAVLTVSDRHTALSGTLQTGAAQTAPSYFIVVFPADRSLWRTPSRRVKTTRAGTDGAFAVRDLPAGDYLIAALPDFEPDDLLDPAFFETLLPASAKVTLGEGEQKTQDLRIGG